MDYKITLIIVGSALLIFMLEKIIPSVKLPESKNWYLRALIFNGFQWVSAFSWAYLWDRWFAQTHLFEISTYHITLQVFIWYLFITFFYYWWHRVRHENRYLWRYLHQFHHSPTRIEVVTSFYKHPWEIVVNWMLSSAILYLFLGLSPYAAWLTVFATAFAELIYHMNLKTPYIMGYFFQRPEMHRLHHKKWLHHYNYSDLPIWDMMFWTFKNPKEQIEETGFPNNNEERVKDLLAGKKMKC